MGNFLSNDLIFRHPDVSPWKAYLNTLQLSTNDVKKLHKIFLDTKTQVEDEEINIGVFCAYINRSNDKLMLKLISYFDCGEKGALNFLEFVFFVWSFLAVEGLGVGRLIFEIYADAEEDNDVVALNNAQLLQIIRDVYPNDTDFESHRIIDLARSTQVGPDGIPLETFLVQADSWGLFKPVYQLQKQMRTKVVSISFWQQITRRKAGGVLSQGKFMGLHEYVHRTVRKRAAEQRKVDQSEDNDDESRNKKSKSSGKKRRRKSSRVNPTDDDNELGDEAKVEETETKKKPEDVNDAYSSIAAISLFSNLKRNLGRLTGAHHNHFFAEADESILKLRRHFRAMQLQEGEVSRLHELFKKMDIRKINLLEKRDFEIFHFIEKTELGSRLFEAWDGDGKGNLDFLMFVSRLWDLCTGGKISAARFAFIVYDRDNDGFIDHEDVPQMLTDIFGKNHLDDMGARGVTVEIETNIKRRHFMNKNNFEEFLQNNHPELMAPIEHLQQNLVKVTMGSHFWQPIITRRHQMLLDGLDFTLEDILDDPKTVSGLLRDPLRGQAALLKRREMGIGSLAAAVLTAVNDNPVQTQAVASFPVGSDEWKRLQASDIRKVTQTYQIVLRQAVRKEKDLQRKERTEFKQQELKSIEEELASEAAALADERKRRCVYFVSRLLCRHASSKNSGGKMTYMPGMGDGGYIMDGIVQKSGVGNDDDEQLSLQPMDACLVGVNVTKQGGGAQQTVKENGCINGCVNSIVGGEGLSAIVEDGEGDGKSFDDDGCGESVGLNRTSGCRATELDVTQLDMMAASSPNLRLQAWNDSEENKNAGALNDDAAVVKHVIDMLQSCKASFGLGGEINVRKLRVTIGNGIVVCNGTVVDTGSVSAAAVAAAVAAVVGDDFDVDIDGAVLPFDVESNKNIDNDEHKDIKDKIEDNKGAVGHDSRSEDMGSGDYDNDDRSYSASEGHTSCHEDDEGDGDDAITDLADVTESIQPGRKRTFPDVECEKLSKKIDGAVAASLASKAIFPAQSGTTNTAGKIQPSSINLPEGSASSQTNHVNIPSSSPIEQPTKRKSLQLRFSFSAFGGRENPSANGGTQEQNNVMAAALAAAKVDSASRHSSDVATTDVSTPSADVVRRPSMAAVASVARRVSGLIGRLSFGGLSATSDEITSGIKEARKILNDDEAPASSGGCPSANSGVIGPEDLSPQRRTSNIPFSSSPAALVPNSTTRGTQEPFGPLTSSRRSSGAPTQVRRVSRAMDAENTPTAAATGGGAGTGAVPPKRSSGPQALLEGTQTRGGGGPPTANTLQAWGAADMLITGGDTAPFRRSSWQPLVHSPVKIAADLQSSQAPPEAPSSSSRKSSVSATGNALNVRVLTDNLTASGGSVPSRRPSFQPPPPRTLQISADSPPKLPTRLPDTSSQRPTDRRPNNESSVSIEVARSPYNPTAGAAAVLSPTGVPILDRRASYRPAPTRTVTVVTPTRPSDLEISPTVGPIRRNSIFAQPARVPAIGDASLSSGGRVAAAGGADGEESSPAINVRQGKRFSYKPVL